MMNLLFGQEIVQNRIIVKIAPDISRADFSASLDTSRYTIEKVLVRRLNIVSIKLITRNKIMLSHVLTQMRY